MRRAPASTHVLRSARVFRRYRPPLRLVPDLRGGRLRLERRLAVASFSDETRIRPRLTTEDSCREDERLREDFGIFKCQVVEDRITLTLELLHDVHAGGMEVAAAADPCRVDETNRVKDKRVAVPPPHGVAIVSGCVLRVVAVLAIV